MSERGRSEREREREEGEKCACVSSPPNSNKKLEQTQLVLAESSKILNKSVRSFSNGSENPYSDTYYSERQHTCGIERRASAWQEGGSPCTKLKRVRQHAFQIEIDRTGTVGGVLHRHAAVAADLAQDLAGHTLALADRLEEAERLAPDQEAEALLIFAGFIIGRFGRYGTVSYDAVL